MVVRFYTSGMYVLVMQATTCITIGKSLYVDSYLPFRRIMKHQKRPRHPMFTRRRFLPAQSSMTDAVVR